MPWVYTDDLPEPQLSKMEEREFEEYSRRRKRKPRFYADEDFPMEAVEMLREWKFNVLTAEEAGKRGHPDENHLAEARKQGRILLTRDHDFLNESRFPLNKCSAVIVCDFGSGTTEEIMRTFQCLHMVEIAPDYFEEWVKLDAKRSGWTELMRFRDGTTSRDRLRLHQGELQVWVDDRAPR